MRCSPAATRPQGLLTFWVKPPTLWTQRHSSTENCLPVRASCSTFITPRRTSPQTSIGRLDAYDTNDAELDEIEQRIDLIYKLRRKYGDTVEDILAFGERAWKELEMIQSSQERVEHLQKEQRRLYTLAREKAEALTQTRLKAFDELNKRISGTLDFLNMPGVRMTLRHSRGPLASHGQDSIEFYISTNPGEARSLWQRSPRAVS